MDDKMCFLTCAEVNDEIKDEDGVWDGVEDDPLCAQVIVEEGDGDGENYEVSDEQDEHEHVPVKPESGKSSSSKTWRYEKQY